MFCLREETIAAAIFMQLLEEELHLEITPVAVFFPSILFKYL